MKRKSNAIQMEMRKFIGEPVTEPLFPFLK